MDQSHPVPLREGVRVGWTLASACIASAEECRWCLQVWADAALQSGCPLTAEQKWQLGTKLVADSGDPVAAQRVFAETNNYYRLMRVLEIVLHTGKTLAELKPDEAAPCDYDFRCEVICQSREVQNPICMANRLQSRARPSACSSSWQHMSKSLCVQP